MNDLLLVLLYATPIILAALGDTIVQRSGSLNIGLEGQMLLGAYLGFVVCQTSSNPWLGLLAGCAGGLMLALLAAWFSISLLADQVVVGTAITLTALGLTGTLYRGKFGQSGQLLSVQGIPNAGGVDAIMILGLLLAALMAFGLFRTRYGLALRAAGEYPEAAESAKYSVQRIRYATMAMGGVLGGLAGAYLSLGVAQSFSENMTQGRGFIAIAMVTFGRWKPQWVLLSCLLIGWLDSLQFAAQARGWNVPFQLLLALPYVIALVVLVAVGKGSIGPAALGKPFRRSR